MVVPKFVAVAELVVVISGFRHFHAERPSSARRSRRTVEQMLVRLQDEPEALLVDFYARCGTGGAGGIDGTEDFGGQSRVVDRRRLHGDLQFLQHSFLDLDSLSGVGRVLLLHGDDDRIVPAERATDLHRALCNSELSVVAAAGHDLPMTHARACWQEIERVWNMRCARR
jgi:pimeloyl-ACP methyl ester carboxylesterase